MLMNLASPGQIQADLFAPAPRPRSQELMATLDRINTSMGRGRVRDIDPLKSITLTPLIEVFVDIRA